MNTKFHIEERVRATDSGLIGIVRDIFTNVAGEALYTVAIQGDTKPHVMIFSEDALEAAPEEVTYRHEFEYLDKVVIARFYETRNGVESEICRGHGHIIHTGTLGIAQAASCALKRIYLNLSEEESEDCMHGA